VSDESYITFIMRTLPLIGTLLVFSSGAAAQTVHDGAICAAKYRHESEVDFVTRARSICEMEWREQASAGKAGVQSHEHFLAQCGRQCVVEAGAVAAAAGASSTTYIVAGTLTAVGVGAGAGVAAMSSSGDKPASP